MNSRVNISKFNNFRNNNITRALNTLAQYLQPMGNAIRFAQAGRNVYRNLVGNGRRKRGHSRNGIEINKAIGGWKSVRYNGRVIGQTINMNMLLVANRYDNFSYYVGTDSTDLTKEFDVARKLNDNDEFLMLRRQALQFKVESICININYNRIPKSGERWNKLLITPETDLVEQSDPLLNKNTMQLDMSQNGTKNYNFRINTRNTEFDNAGWIIGQAQFSGIVKLYFSELDSNIGDAEETDFSKTVLGTVQIAVRVLYIHKDINQSDARNIKDRTKYTQGEINKYVNKLMLKDEDVE